MSKLDGKQFQRVCEALEGVEAITAFSWRNRLITHVYEFIVSDGMHDHRIVSEDKTIITKLEKLSTVEFDDLLAEVSKHWQQCPSILNPNLRGALSL